MVEQVVEPCGQDDDATAERLAAVVKRWRIRAPQVVLSLSRNAATVRNLHLPSQDDQEIAQMVDLNIVRMVPYKKEDVVCGYRVLGKDDTGYTRVLTVIIRSDSLRRYVAVVEKAGLYVDSLTLASYGVWHFARAKKRLDGLCLVLDVDADFTDCMVFDKDNLLFTRSINIGAAALSGDPEAASVKFLGEVKQSLVMFYNEETSRKPARVVVCGAKAGNPLAVKVQEELDVPVEVWDAPAAVAADASVASLMVVGQDGAGEALLDLPEIQVRKALRRDVADMVLFGALFCYFIILLGGFYWAQVYVRESYLARLNERTTSLERSLADIAEKSGKIDFVRARLAARQVPGIVLFEVQNIIPENVAIVALTMDDKGKVVLRGQADGLSSAFQFIDSLGKVKRFKDVQTRSTRKKKVKEKDLTDFEVGFSFQ